MPRLNGSPIRHAGLVAELGIVGDAPHFVVDTAGALGPIGKQATIEWGIGADDRWHFASSEPALRQRLADDETTIETRLRIPSGDAGQRVVVVPAAGSSAARVEIENASRVPVALAIVVHTSPGSISVIDDAVLVDGNPMLRASRSIALITVGDGGDEVRSQIESGATHPPGERDWPQRGSVVGLVFPLPHTAVVRFVAAHGPVPELPGPEGVPPLDAVARGWQVHIDPTMQLTVPDQRVVTALHAARRHLLSGSALGPEASYWSQNVSPWVPPVAAVALNSWGHTLEARELLLAASGPDDLVVHARRPPAATGALLWAWAEWLERHADPDLESALMPWVEEVAIGLLARRGWFSRRMNRSNSVDDAWRAVGLASAGSLLSRGGREWLGADIVEALPQFRALAEPGGGVALALGGNRLGSAQGSIAKELVGRLETSPSGTSLGHVAAVTDTVGAFGLDTRTQHPEASALLLLAARAAVVAEPAGTGGGVALMPDPDRDWLGAPLEVHRAPVTAGLLSFGLRWHDERPALLWELEADPGHALRGTDWSLSSPFLDPTWSDDRLTGEALLGPTSGFDASQAPESAEVRRGEAVEIDDGPDSFQ